MKVLPCCQPVVLHSASIEPQGKLHSHPRSNTIYQVFIHQLMHKLIILKTFFKFTLKWTLKQLRHVSVQSPSSGSAIFELAKVTVVKIIN
jgi:hypothetical protein